MSEITRLKSVEQNPSSPRFGGLPYEKALTIAEKYLDPSDVVKYLRPFLEEGKLITSIAYQLGDSEPETVERHIKKLESQVAEAHLANIPRGYGHTATILTIVRDKDSA